MLLSALNILRCWRAREARIAILGLHEAGEAARVQASSFARGWSEAEMEGLMAQGTVTAIGARIARSLAAFVLLRTAGGEAEILTIASSPGWRGCGLARRIMREALDRAALAGATRCFLEVDDGNIAALALYRSLGFTEVGRRFGYYKHEGGGDALVLARDLSRQNPVIPPPDIAQTAKSFH